MINVRPKRNAHAMCLRSFENSIAPLSTFHEKIIKTTRNTRHVDIPLAYIHSKTKDEYLNLIKQIPPIQL